MQRTGTVNYHVHKAERQSFELDANGIVGNLISPELAPTRVTLTDIRGHTRTMHFSEEGFTFLVSPSHIQTFSESNWQEGYNQEVTQLLTEKLSACEVVIFDHTIRVDDPEATRKPARNVHSDYSDEGARQRLIDLLGSQKAQEWEQGHYAFINLWRPIGQRINSAPLGFVRPSSVDREDWILLDLIYPDRKGQIMGLVGNENHEWVYLSNMTPDEVAVFNIYDNQGLPSVAHSALDLVEDPTVSIPRKSIESRTLVRF